MRQSAAQRQLNRILKEHSVQPVGGGYLDCICPREEVEAFLTELRSAGFAVSDYSLWQYVRSQETAVHGMGGPRCRNRAGWYSEMGILRPWQGGCGTGIVFNSRGTATSVRAGSGLLAGGT